MGYRIDARSVAGTEKEIGDEFFERFTRYLRSMQFKTYMSTQSGGTVIVPPGQMSRGWRDLFGKEFEGVMKFNLTTKLWTFINTLEDIP